MDGDEDFGIGEDKAINLEPLGLKERRQLILGYLQLSIKNHSR